MRLRPSPRMKTLYTLYVALALLLGVFSWSVPLALLIPEALSFMVLVAWLPAAVAALLFAYWLPKYYSSIEYSIEGGRALARRGVWFKHESSVPLAKVNNVVWRQGPLQRILGLASLGFHTAAMGVAAPEVCFDHLDALKAAEVREEMLAVIGQEGPRRESVERLLGELLEELRAIRRLLESRAPSSPGAQPTRP